MQEEFSKGEERLCERLRLSGEEAAVVQALSDKPARVDILIERTGLAAPAVLGTLTMLEVRGLVQALPGGSFSLRRKT